MRQQSEKQVRVRGAVIGGALPLICLPLVGQSRIEVLQEAETLEKLQPDLLEWRVDGFELVENTAECLSLLKDIRRIIGDTALIFTCRIDVEGGMNRLSRSTRLQLYTEAIRSGDIDIIDVELCNDRRFLDSIRARTRENQVRLILSYHNFEQTPGESFIYDTLAEAQKEGADIAKFAAMPRNHGDVLRLFNATLKARNEGVQIPMASISMGTIGAISRIAGGLFGSDITFGVGARASAPGQLPLEDLKSGLALLYTS